MSRGNGSVVLGPVHQMQTIPDDVNKILSKLMIGDPLHRSKKPSVVSLHSTRLAIIFLDIAY
jgi:hypothetical protein